MRQSCEGIVRKAAELLNIAKKVGFKILGRNGA